MISYFIWLMKLVRTKILEGLILPELDISYWDFCIILAVVGVVATVLINSVRISGSVNKENVYEKEKQRSKERMRAWEDAKAEHNNSRQVRTSYNLDLFEEQLNCD